MKMTLLLIEDNLKHVENIQNAIEEFSSFKDERGEKWTFSTIHLTGDEEKTDIDNGTFQFYSDTVFKQIQDKINMQTETERIGLLLDTMLTQSEFQSRRRNDGPILNLSPKIYKKFHRELPIYIVTSISSFYTNSERFMGIDLSEYYIDYEILTEYKLKSAIEKLQNFFVHWKKENTLQTQK